MLAVDRGQNRTETALLFSSLSQRLATMLSLHSDSEPAGRARHQYSCTSITPPLISYTTYRYREYSSTARMLGTALASVQLCRV